MTFPGTLFHELFSHRCLESYSQLDWRQDQTGLVITIAKNIRNTSKRRLLTAMRHHDQLTASLMRRHGAPDFVELTEKRDLLFSLHEALTALPIRYQRVLQAVLTPGDTKMHAKQLGINPTTFRINKMRGIERLKRSLAAAC